jgi:uncharacterized protein (AIM24 family)
MMASNHKLTAVLKGHTVTGTASQGNELRVSFDDGSTMTVKTGETSSQAQARGRIQGVRQQGTKLSLDFEGGGTMEIQTAEPTASVMVRDRNHRLEYTD